MRRENNLMVCTVKEFANFLSEGIDTSEPLDSVIRECDFAVLDDECTGCDIETVKAETFGWYGVKVVPDLGFDTESLILIADYYGGGCEEFCSIWSGIDSFVDPAESILSMIISCVGRQEWVDDDSILFVEMKRRVCGSGLPEKNP